MAGKANASPSPATKRRVMVVADPTTESMGALQYVLSHAMQDNDDVILMHVINNPKRSNSIKSLSLFRRHSDPGTGTFSSFDPSMAANEGSSRRRGGGRSSGGGGSDNNNVGGDFLETMRSTCKGMYPNARVWIERVEQKSFDNNNNNNNNKGGVILHKCKELSVDLLVVGQRCHLVSVLLGPRRTLSSGAPRGGISSKSIDMVDYLIENSPCTCVAVQKKGQNSQKLLAFSLIIFIQTIIHYYPF